MKRPMTTAELFEKINGLLKDKGKLPEILDYGLAEYDSKKITTYEFDLKSSLNYGSSEGIYLDFWIEWYADGEKRVGGLGTYKTLRDDEEAMHIMANLLADFIVTEHRYVNANLDDFTWTGADVYPLDECGNRMKWGYSCSNMEAALKRKEELLKNHPQVLVRDNAARKEKIFKQTVRDGKGGEAAR